MQSEIPQLEVVTAIGDAEDEDYIAQLLFSQGWSIIYRALDMGSLLDFFEKRPAELRTIIVYKEDLADFNLSELNNLITPSTTCISLDGIPTNSHEIMVHLRSSIRLPLITGIVQTTSTPEVAKKSFKNILVTGTEGSPGRSTLALNLALELDYAIFDLDFRAPAQSYLINRSEVGVELKTLGAEKPREFESNSDAVLDIGPLPPLDQLVNDRRWSAALLNSVLDCASDLIFVCRASGLSLIRLEKFISQFPILLRKIPITYVFNLAGNSREERALEKHFLKMVSGERNLVIPSDLRIQNPVKSGSKAIGKLAALIS